MNITIVNKSNAHDLAEEVIRQLEIRYKNRSPLYRRKKLKDWEMKLLIMAYDALNKPLPTEYKEYARRLFKEERN